MLAWLLENLIKVGCLTVIDANGKKREYRGSGGPEVTIRLHKRSLNWTLPLNPELRLGEAYMDGTLTVENGSIYDLLDLVGRNYANLQQSPFHRIGELCRLICRPIHQFNPPWRSRANVAHHYDLSGELYDLFLDQDRQYSCAYFNDPRDDLDTAQENKKKHIAAKLLLEPNHRVLDIGCGWGGMALSLARHADVRVTGVTLSTEQLETARDRAEKAQLAQKVEFALRDYRHQEGRFDRIVSVGMFEHVGVTFYRTFFSKVRDLLTDDGVAVLHTIGRSDGPGATSSWIRKYIFPGGYIPALSEVVSAVEKSGLVMTDIEILRLHYAETLRHWRKRFLKQWDRAAKIYDDRFCRMWEFYLAGSEIAFRYMGLVVFQVQMGRRQEAVPLTRDYITETDERLRNGRQAA